jgi:hypothetical protein
MVLAVVALLFGCGCGTSRVVLRPAVTNDVPVTTREAVPVITTNEVVSSVLNPIPGLPEIRTTKLVTITNTMYEIRTNIIRVITPEVAYTNLALNPLVSGGVQLAGQLAPVPWAGAASGIFGIVSGGVLAWINNRRRKAALGEAESWQDTAGILVENVEAVRKAALALPSYTREMDLKVIRGIESAQRLAGVKDRIHGLVEQRTDDTVPVV